MALYYLRDAVGYETLREHLLHSNGRKLCGTDGSLDYSTNLRESKLETRYLEVYCGWEGLLIYQSYKL